MATIASLAIDLTANSAQLVRELQSVNRRMSDMERSARSAARGITSAFAAIVSVGAIKDVTMSVLDTAASFETLKASLETVFGSQEEAAKRFEDINKFASQTPFSIQDLTEATIKMKALGLDPSIESMESMGNTASAMGKPLMQFVEAVADAVTGEMERLKEFGIRASKEGEQFKFIFQGMEKTVAFNANSIQEYLMNIGNVNFAGAMDKQSETLQGSFAALQGSVDNLANSFAEKSGLAGAAKEAAQWLTELFTHMATGQATVGALEAKVASLQESLNNRARGGRNRRANSARTDRIKEEIEALNLEITQRKAMAGSVEDARKVISMLNEDIKELNATVQEGDSLFTGRGRNRTLSEAGIVQQKIDELKERKESFEELLLTLQTKTEETQAQTGSTTPTATSLILGEDPASELSKVEQHLLSQEQLLQDAFVRRMAVLESAKEDELLTEERFNDLSFKLRQKHLEGLTKLESLKATKEVQVEKSKSQSKLSIAANFFSAAGQLNDKFFKVSKILGAAHALISTYQGQAEALKLPYPANLAAAAQVGAAGFGFVAAIRAASPSAGGGSVGVGSGAIADSIAGGDSLTEAIEDEQITKTVTLNIEGINDDQLLSKDQVRQIIDQINEEEAANVRIVGL